MAKLYARNKAYLAAGQHSYNTQLNPQQEQQFRAWLQQAPPHDFGRREFNPNAPVTDYDMRGFWLAQQAGDPRATEVVKPDGVHRNDYWKTPYDKSFSAESQWADPAKAPRWNDKDQLVMPDGTVIFDERATLKAGGTAG